MKNLQELSKSRVFVVHSRNDMLCRALFDFLRAIDLKPIEWSEAVDLTGESISTYWRCPGCRHGVCASNRRAGWAAQIIQRYRWQAFHSAEKHIKIKTGIGTTLETRWL